MKKQIILATLFYLTTSFYVAAQHQHASHMEVDMNSDEIEKFNVDLEFQNQLFDVVLASQSLKEAFSKDNPNETKLFAKVVTNKLGSIDMSLLKGESHQIWMGYSKILKSSVNKILESKDIHSQRIMFAEFNGTLFNTLKSFGTGGNAVYYQYCPMAFDNKGAYWLSSSGEIQNPYLGKSMPKCGSTKEILN